VEKQNPVARKDGMSSVGKLKLISKYRGEYQPAPGIISGMVPPMCDAEHCTNRAQGYYSDESGLGFDLCADHIRQHVPTEVSA